MVWYMFNSYESDTVRHDNLKQDAVNKHHVIHNSYILVLV